MNKLNSVFIMEKSTLVLCTNNDITQVLIFIIPRKVSTYDMTYMYTNKKNSNNAGKSIHFELK